MRFYTIEPAPRSNPQGRLDEPWNVVTGISRCLDEKKFVAVGFSRDDAEAKLQKIADRLELERVESNVYKLPPDFDIAFDGSLWTVRPRNKAARAHLEENVQSDAQWFGVSLIVEHRYIGDLVEGLSDAGFRVRVN